MSETDRKAIATARAKVPQWQATVRGVQRIADALNRLDGGLINTGPIDQLAVRYTESGQELEKAVGAIQNSMLALTRVPGIGAQSDLEARIAAMQYPSLENHPEVNRRRLEDLQFFIRDLAQAYESLLSGANSTQAPAAPANGGRAALPPGFSWED